MDLIERQAAIDALKSQLSDWNDDYNIPVRKSIENIERLPSAQPEIIRCKDCKDWDTTWQNDWAKNYHYCPLVDGTRNGDWYCADAERRTDE